MPVIDMRGKNQIGNFRIDIIYGDNLENKHTTHCFMMTEEQAKKRVKSLMKESLVSKYKIIKIFKI